MYVCVCVCVFVCACAYARVCVLHACACVCCLFSTCKIVFCAFQVRGIVNNNLPEYKRLRARAKKGLISTDDSLWVMSLLANALTIHVTFGRPSLFQRLTVGHGRQAVAGRVCGSSNFKTWARWFVNSMFFCDGARSILRPRSNFCMCARPVTLVRRVH